MQISLLALAFARCAAGTMRSLDASRAATTIGTQRDAAEFSYPIPTGHRWVMAHGHIGSNVMHCVACRSHARPCRRFCAKLSQLNVWPPT